MDDPSRFSVGEFEFLGAVWNALLPHDLPRSTYPRHNLLHLHSTPCLLRWVFRPGQGTHPSSSCTRSVCLDDDELLARTTELFQEDRHATFDRGTSEVQRFIHLLEALGLTGMVGELLSHFFDELFPTRCARILAHHLSSAVVPDADDEECCHVPSVWLSLFYELLSLTSLFSWSYLTTYLDRAFLETRQLWYWGNVPSCENSHSIFRG